jgi:glyoxylase-like metal-dependent hydrolase (beta-lactamase superfamily II)
MLALVLALASISPDYESLIAFDEVQVAPGVVTFAQHGKNTAVVSGNVTAVVGDDGVLVVDTGHFPEATRRIIARIKKITPKPVRWVVNTHWHSDHIRGNRLFAEAWPGLAIIGTEATRAQFANPGVQDELGFMEGQAKQVRELLASGKVTDEKKRAYYTSALRELEVFGPDIAGAKPLASNLTFRERLTVHLGGRDAQVLFLGRGNTEGDTLVWLPESKTLMTGDLVVFPAPYAFGSFFSEWGPTLRKAIALGPTTIVPGHGPVMHDDSYLRLVADAVETVSSQVGALQKQGLAVEEVRKKLDVSALRQKFAHGDEQIGRGFDGYFLGPGVPRAYREAKEGHPLQDED